jgi:hypothetical protein
MKQLSKFRLACSATLVIAAFCSGAAHANDRSDRLAKLEKAVQRASDVEEIQNLMSRRMFYHSVGRNEEELALWSKKHPIRWGQNQGCWTSMASLKVYYDDINRKMQAADLSRLSKLNPAIKDVPENRGIGNNAIHTLTTPIIEVAGDGQTAKGMWIWERYGVDFVREDGHWAFLHVQVNTDFMNDMGKPMQVQAEDAAAMGSEGAGGPGGGPMIKIPGPDVPAKLYREFGATRVPTLVPRVPEPYQTLSKTFEYADCSAK